LALAKIILIIFNPLNEFNGKGYRLVGGSRKPDTS